MNRRQQKSIVKVRNEHLPSSEQPRTCFAVEQAVLALSPVRSTTRMPIRLSAHTASDASLFTLSAMEIIATVSPENERVTLAGRSLADCH